MTFFSPEFALCFMIFFVIYWAFARFVLVQKYLILIASYAFICVNSISFGLILFFYTCFVFFAGRWLLSRAISTENSSFEQIELLKYEIKNLQNKVNLEIKKNPKKKYKIELEQKIQSLEEEISQIKTQALEQNPNASLLLSLVFLCISFLAFFKYFDEISEFFNLFVSFFGFSELGMMSIAFPLGISYYTFMSITYLVALSKGRAKRHADFVSLACFLAFFPSIVMGPISRAVSEKGLRALLPQFNRRKKFTGGDEIFVLFIFACVKFLLIAGLLGPYVNDVFSGVYSSDYSLLELISAILLYSVVLYANFSGFIDLVRALALCLGFELAPNFNMPYAKKNIKEFWKAWHITLTTFIMRYIYIPLGGSKHGILRTQINVLIAFALSGIWHGAGLNFLIWGALHGLALVIFNLYKDFVGIKFNYFFGTILTYIFVSFAWVFFANDFETAIAIFSSFSRLELYHNYSEFVIILFILLCVMFYYKSTGLFSWLVIVLQNTALLPKVLILGLIFTLIIAFMPSGIPNFIYASF